MATTTRKTIKQWLKGSLTHEEYAKAEKYHSKRWDTVTVSCAFNALLNGFFWNNTDEGWGYWFDISKRLKP